MDPHDLFLLYKNLNLRCHQILFSQEDFVFFEIRGDFGMIGTRQSGEGKFDPFDNPFGMIHSQNQIVQFATRGRDRSESTSQI